MLCQKFVFIRAQTFEIEGQDLKYNYILYMQKLGGIVALLDEEWYVYETVVHTIFEMPI